MEAQGGFDLMKGSRMTKIHHRMILQLGADSSTK